MPAESPPAKILVCLGTRPEAIKLAPVVRELGRRSAFQVSVCATAQHRQMLDQVLEIFEVVPDYDLDIMVAGQTLEGLTSALTASMAGVMRKAQPDLVMVQGDTTTTFVSALVAFYNRVPVAHVEAGLRTFQKYAPFPEEMNRQMTSCLTDWHFPPTERARDALLAEGFPAERVVTVGNPVIDALKIAVGIARANDARYRERFPQLDLERPLLLVTGHRRENFGDGFRRICTALRAIATEHADLQVVYPVHLNPNVRKPVYETLGELPNLHLIEPQDYLSFVWLLDRCRIVLTDSGGVQEEAPSLGKPVLVMRDSTERPEAVEAGVARLVGTDIDAIVGSVRSLLRDDDQYQRMSRSQNPYGDGTSSIQIADMLEAAFAEGRVSDAPRHGKRN